MTATTVETTMAQRLRDRVAAAEQDAKDYAASEAAQGWASSGGAIEKAHLLGGMRQILADAIAVIEAADR